MKQNRTLALVLFTLISCGGGGGGGSNNSPVVAQTPTPPATPPTLSFDELKDLLEKAGRDIKVADLDELGAFVVQAVHERRFIIGRDLDDTVDLLHRRADAIADFQCPPHHDMGL